MRMGVDADRADATELLSTGVGAIKADAPPMRSIAVHAAYFGGAMIVSHVFNPYVCSSCTSVERVPRSCSRQQKAF